MAQSAGIHWHEGLFLQPHHLQRMQQFLLEQDSRQRRFSWAYPYGVIGAQLAEDDLANGYLRYERLHAVMPSGREIRVPDNTDLPVLAVKDALAAAGGSLTVRLALPVWSSTRANTTEEGGGDDWRVKRIYRVQEDDCPDENTGDNPQALRFRRLNARLLLPGQDDSDLETFPLVRIVPGVGDQSGMPRQDPEYIPPSLSVSGNGYLREVVMGIASAVEANSRELARQLTNERGAGVDVDVEPMMRLHTLNRYGARFGPIVKAPTTTPFEMYVQLRELFGELCALRIDEDPYDVPDYDHDNPGVCFQILNRKIRALLKRAVRQRALTVDFDKQGGRFTAELTEEHLTRPTAYYLAITTKTDPRDLVRLVETGDKFKLMAPSRSKGRAVLGVTLEVDHAPPAAFPRQTGTHYFRIQRREKDVMWQAVQAEKTMVVVGVAGEVADFAITLYMTVPETQEARS